MLPAVPPSLRSSSDAKKPKTPSLQHGSMDDDDVDPSAHKEVLL